MLALKETRAYVFPFFQNSFFKNTCDRLDTMQSTYSLISKYKTKSNAYPSIYHMTLRHNLLITVLLRHVEKNINQNVSCSWIMKWAYDIANQKVLKQYHIDKGFPITYRIAPIIVILTIIVFVSSIFKVIWF